MSVNTRRINPLAEKKEDRLKAIAGLIEKLTYQEMMTLAGMICDDVDRRTPNEIPAGLLKIATRILSEDRP